MDKRIRLYGIFNVTKKEYLRGQIVCAFLVIYFWIWAIVGDFNELLFGYGILILIIGTLGEILETYIMLRKFRKR